MLATSVYADESKLSTKEILWGNHWAGTKVKNSQALKGKVVLLKIWGG